MKPTTFLIIFFFVFLVKIQAQAVVSVDKQNVLYVGVDNPVEIAIEGVSLDEIEAAVTGCGIVLIGAKGKYIARVTSPGEAKITVLTTKNGVTTKLGAFPFRCKRIPDATVVLFDEQSNGTVTAGRFKAIDGISLFMPNFDFAGTCEIQSFELTVILPNENPQTVFVEGAKYNAAALQLRNLAKPGAVYYFDNVKARCPGDLAARKINPMIWKIK